MGVCSIVACGVAMGLRLSLSAAGAVGAVLLCAMPAIAADAPSVAATRAPLQAVDGLNGKLEAGAGSFGGTSLYAGSGAIAFPLGPQFGFQLDGLAGSLGGNTTTAVAAHLFWRDPAAGLVGLYAGHSRWDRLSGVQVNQVGGEAERYWGRWTLRGYAGVEFGNTAIGVTGTTTQTIDIRTRFFDAIDVGYYLTDNLKAYAGHRYFGGKHAAAAGAEAALPLGRGMMGSAFAEGRAGESGAESIWAGLRFYFGQADKPLIARHRQDDPTIWATNAAGTMTGNGTGSSTVPPRTGGGPPCCL